MEAEKVVGRCVRLFAEGVQPVEPRTDLAGLPTLQQTYAHVERSGDRLLGADASPSLGESFRELRVVHKVTLDDSRRLCHGIS